MGLRSGLDRCGKFRLHQDSIPGPSSPYVLHVHGKNGWANAHQNYRICTFPDLLSESRQMLLRTSLSCQRIIVIFGINYAENCSAALLQCRKEKCIT